MRCAEYFNATDLHSVVSPKTLQIKFLQRTENLSIIMTKEYW